jgi:hypothetical protein
MLTYGVGSSFKSKQFRARNPPLGPVFNQMNQLHSFTHYITTVYSDITLPSMPSIAILRRKLCMHYLISFMRNRCLSMSVVISVNLNEQGT